MPRASKPARKREPRKGEGRPVGYRVTEATREKLRARIKGDAVIDRLHKLMADGGQHDGVQVSAAKVLLDRILPTLASTDLTSGGESFTVERVVFKPDGK
jgi:hypothetical protein